MYPVSVVLGEGTAAWTNLFASMPRLLSDEAYGSASWLPQALHVRLASAITCQKCKDKGKQIESFGKPKLAVDAKEEIASMTPIVAARLWAVRDAAHP